VHRVVVLRCSHAGATWSPRGNQIRSERPTGTPGPGIGSIHSQAGAEPCDPTGVVREKKKKKLKSNGVEDGPSGPDHGWSRFHRVPSCR
jgi:hypothetical protein